MKTKKDKVGRPRKEIDPKQVTKLARFGLSGEEIAVVVGCSRDLLYKNFSTAIKDGHEFRNQSLRRKQYEVAMKGNPTMLIWLGKQFLGQHDKHEVGGFDGKPITYSDVTAVDQKIVAIVSEVFGKHESIQ